MGLFQRLLSLGGKRNKDKKQPKSRRSLPLEPTLISPLEDPEEQATISRLLRSSSTRFTVMNLEDYPPLPPLPAATLPLPTGSPSRGMSTIGLHRRGTYSVTLLSRTLEFPPIPRNHSTPTLHDHDLHDESMSVASLPPSPSVKPVTSVKLATPRTRTVPVPVHDEDSEADRTVRYDPVTPGDKKRLHRLRQDPSVLSLLNLYDNDGRLDDKAFTNTPHRPRSQTPKVVRETTLKDLLRTAGDKGDGSAEGDISWADRTLGLRASSSSLSTTSSLGLQTPTSPVYLEDPNATKKQMHTRFDDGISLTTVTSNDNLPAISSLEVELSTEDRSSEEESYAIVEASPVKLNRRLSQRASQVFRFLDDRERGQRNSALQDKRMQLPTPLSSSLSTPSLVSASARSVVSMNSLLTPSALTVGAGTIPYVRDNRSATPSPPPSPSPSPPLSKVSTLQSRPQSSAETSPLIIQSESIHRTPQTTLPKKYAFESPAPPSATATLALRPPPSHVQRKGSVSSTLCLASDTSRTVVYDAPAPVLSTSTRPLPLAPKGPRAPSPGATMFASTNTNTDRAANAQARADAMLASFASSAFRTNSVSRSQVHPQPEMSSTDAYTPITPRGANCRPGDRLSRELGNTNSIDQENAGGSSGIYHGKAGTVTSHRSLKGKENDNRFETVAVSSSLALPMKALPLTPLRTRTLLHPASGLTPSPASSSELSPEAKQIMADLRSLRSKSKSNLQSGTLSGLRWANRVPS